MVRRSRAATSPVIITPQRAARLHRLVLLLRAGPQTRHYLCRHLCLDVRTFYRDLDLLRSCGIPLPMQQHQYHLTLDLPAVYRLLPFPDPGLSLAEALELSVGRTAAHRKLKAQIEAILSEPLPARRKGS